MFQVEHIDIAVMSIELRKIDSRQCLYMMLGKLFCETDKLFLTSHAAEYQRQILICQFTAIKRCAQDIQNMNDIFFRFFHLSFRTGILKTEDHGGKTRHFVV